MTKLQAIDKARTLFVDMHVYDTLVLANITKKEAMALVREYPELIQVRLYTDKTAILGAHNPDEPGVLLVRVSYTHGGE